MFFKVIIAGTRTFADMSLLTAVCNIMLSNYRPEEIEIVCGCAAGADHLGEMYAASRNIKVKRFTALWDKYGKSAGYIRNKEMAVYSDAAIIFWDGKSKGTSHMIDLAKAAGLQLKVKIYEQ